jgi:hypothetical protein
MSEKISNEGKRELLEVLRRRYQRAAKHDKGKILDEFTAVADCHRKHAIRLLTAQPTTPITTDPLVARRTYDEAVREVLVVLWEAADRICGKRLKAILPGLLAAFERHGHLKLDPDVRRHKIRDCQAALAALSSGELQGEDRQSLEEFLASLPELWRQGEARPTHREAPAKPRHWRTRKDPFEGVWPEILLWLQEQPEATAKSLFERLGAEVPGAVPFRVIADIATANPRLAAGDGAEPDSRQRGRAGRQAYGGRCGVAWKRWCRLWGVSESAGASQVEGDGAF